MSPIAEYDLGTARGRIDIDHTSIGRAGDAFVSMGKSFLVGGAALAGGFGYVVYAAAGFEQRMSAVEAVTNATTVEMELLTQAALDLGAKGVYGPDEVARAMEQLAKAGIPVETILNGATEATITFAAAAGDELAGGIDEAAVVMANALKIFDGGAEDMEHFSDVLVGAAAASTLSVDDIATSMRYAGPIASTLGFSIDDLSTALAILGDRGIRGSTAGTSLRGVLISLTPSSKKAENAMRDLGIITADGTNKFYELDGSLKPLPEIMEILGQSIEGLSEQEKVAAFNAIFQRRAMNSALELAQAGADGYYDYANAIGELSAADIAATKLDNLSGDVLILKNSFATLIREAGLPLQDMLRGVVQNLTELVDKVREVNPEIAAQVVMWTGIAGAVLTAIGTFLTIVGVVARLYRNFVLLKAGIATVLAIPGAPLIAIVAIIAAIAGALYLAWTRSETFRNIVIEAFNRIREAAETAVEWLRTNLIPIFEDVMDVGRDVGQTLVDGWSVFVDWAEEQIGPVIEQLGELFDAVFERISSIVRNLMPTFRAVGSFLEAWFNQTRAIVELFIQIVVSAWQLFHDNIWNIVQIAWNYIRTTIEAFLQIIRGVIQTVTALIRGDWGGVWDGIFQILRGVWQLITNLINTAMDLLYELIFVGLDAIRLVWRNIWDVITTLLDVAWDTMFELVRVALNAIGAVIDGVLTVIASLWSSAWTTISTTLSGIWNTIYTTLQNNLTTITTWFSELPGRIVGALSTLGEQLRNLTRAAMSIATGFLKGIYEGWLTVKDWVGDIPSMVVSAIGDIASALWDVGWEVMDGLWQGMTSGWNQVTDWLSGLNPANWFNDINPYKGHAILNLVDTGNQVFQGLQNGMEQGWADAARWLKSIDPSSQLSVSGLATAAPAAGGSSSTTVQFNFNGDVAPGAGDEVVAAIESSGMIEEIIRATRAGRR